MEAYNFPVGGSLLVNLRNVGSASVDIGGADYFIDGVDAGTPTGSCAGATLAPSDSCTATLSPIGSSLVSGAAYPFKIVTSAGGVFSYTIVYGGSS